VTSCDVITALCWLFNHLSCRRHLSWAWASLSMTSLCLTRYCDSNGEIPAAVVPYNTGPVWLVWEVGKVFVLLVQQGGGAQTKRSLLLAAHTSYLHATCIMMRCT
jgi:hypothetical protein